MTNLSSKSLLFSFLSKLSLKTYESNFVNYFIALTNKLIAYFLHILRQNYFFKKITPIQWKSIVLFLFIISLPIVPSSQVELSSLQTSGFDANAINQRHFGIVIISLSNLLLIPLFAFMAVQYKRKNFKFYNFEIPLIAFLLLSEFSVINSVNLQTSFIWLLKFIFSILIYVLFSRISLDSKHLRVIFYAFIITILMQGGLAILQFLKGGLIGMFLENPDRFVLNRLLYPFSGTLYFKSIGTLSHPNLLSAYLILLLPLLLLICWNDYKFSKTLLYLTFIVFVGGLVTTLSRWAMATSLFVVCFSLLLYKNVLKFSLKRLFNSSKTFLLIIFLIILALLVNPLVSHRFLTFSPNDASLMTRLSLLSQAIYIIQNNPQGIGAGASIPLMANYDFTPNTVSTMYLFDVHEFYLLLPTELGILALLTFLLFILFLTKLFFMRIGKLKKEKKILAITLFISIIAFLFSGLWEPRTFTDRAGFLFFLLLGLFTNTVFNNLPITHLSKTTH